MNEGKVLCKQNVVMTVEEKVSQKTGKPFKAVFVTLSNGEKINVGFVNVYTENAMLKAGLKI